MTGSISSIYDNVKLRKEANPHIREDGTREDLVFLPEMKIVSALPLFIRKYCNRKQAGQPEKPPANSDQVTNRTCEKTPYRLYSAVDNKAFPLF